MADITENNLPMDVREHLMRGHWDDAIKLLSVNHDMSENEARELIKRYRLALKERNVELEVMKMQNTFSRATEQEARQKKVNIMRTIFALIVLAMIILLLTTIKI